MTLRNLLVAGLAVVALTLFMACQPGSSGGGGSGGSTTTNDNVADNDNDNVADNENTTDDQNANEDDQEPELTDEEAEAAETAADATQNLAGLFTALAAGGLPSTDEGPIVITPNPFSQCPTLTLDQGALTVDYGDGCNPAIDPGSTYAGSFTVEVNVEDGTLAVTFNDLAIDGETINGTAVVTASQEGMVITLETDINVTFSTDGYAVTYIGDVTAEINLDTGEMVISQADLEAIDDTGDTYGIILDDVHIVLVEILPYSGTATIILGTEDEFPLTVVVRFTEDTPTDGTVYVSVNGSPEVRMSLEDVEVEQ
jgi:hypothetical protein